MRNLVYLWDMESPSIKFNYRTLNDTIQDVGNTLLYMCDAMTKSITPHERIGCIFVFDSKYLQPTYYPKVKHVYKRTLREALFNLGFPVITMENVSAYDYISSFVDKYCYICRCETKCKNCKCELKYNTDVIIVSSRDCWHTALTYKGVSIFNGVKLITDKDAYTKDEAPGYKTCECYTNSGPVRRKNTSGDNPLNTHINLLYTLIGEYTNEKTSIVVNDDKRVSVLRGG